MLFTVISILILIICILLTLIVLVQNSKGGGLSSTFAGSNQIVGVRKTADFLEKATWTLAIALMFLSLVSSAVINRGGEEEAESAIQEKIDETPAPTQAPPNLPPVTPPGGPE